MRRSPARQGDSWRAKLTAGRRFGAPVAALSLAAAIASGCSGPGATQVAPIAHRIRVAASVFPLAEMARRVGLDRVAVNETVTDLGQAQVVLLVGRGFQPDLERAAAGRPGVVALWDGLGGDDPDFWLDPVAMQRATDLVTDVLSRADPAGRVAYQASARSFKAQLGALDIDYHSSLAGCVRRDLVTADGAFARVAARYGLISHAAGDPGVLQLIRSRDVRTVFTEPPRPPGPAEALARAANIKTVPLATLATRTPEQAARGATYLALMTDNLDKIRTALVCTESSP